MHDPSAANEPEKLFAGTLDGPVMKGNLRVEFLNRGAKTGMRLSSDFEACSFFMRLLLPFMKSAVSKRQANDVATFRRLVEAGEI